MSFQKPKGLFEKAIFGMFDSEGYVEPQKFFDEALHYGYYKSLSMKKILKKLDALVNSGKMTVEHFYFPDEDTPLLINYYWKDTLNGITSPKH